MGEGGPQRARSTEEGMESGGPGERPGKERCGKKECDPASLPGVGNPFMKSDETNPNSGHKLLASNSLASSPRLAARTYEPIDERAVVKRGGADFGLRALAHPLRRRLRSIWPISDLSADELVVQIRSQRPHGRNATAPAHLPQVAARAVQRVYIRSRVLSTIPRSEARELPGEPEHPPDRLQQGRCPGGDRRAPARAQPAGQRGQPGGEGPDHRGLRRAADAPRGGGEDLRRRRREGAGRRAGLHPPARRGLARSGGGPGLRERAGDGIPGRRSRLPRDAGGGESQHPRLPAGHPQPGRADRARAGDRAGPALSAAPPGRGLHPGRSGGVSVDAADDGRPGTGGGRPGDRRGGPADAVRRLQPRPPGRLSVRSA